MITFVCCLIALIVGYFIYGKFIERIFGIDAKRQAPAYTHQDGVDYIPMPTWKVFMIQFLNIAGLGPIFGAIMGAKFGTASFLWIVLGSIFAGEGPEEIFVAFSECTSDLVGFIGAGSRKRCLLERFGTSKA